MARQGAAELACTSPLLFNCATATTFVEGAGGAMCNCKTSISGTDPVASCRGCGQSVLSPLARFQPGMCHARRLHRARETIEDAVRREIHEEAA